MKKPLLFLVIPIISVFCTGCNDPLKIATTTSDFTGIEGFDSDKEKIKAIHDAGFQFVDLSFYSLPKDSEYLKNDWKQHVLDLKAYADELGVKFVQAHSPGGNPNSDNPEEVDYLVDITKRSIEICEVLGNERESSVIQLPR